MVNYIRCCLILIWLLLPNIFCMFRIPRGGPDTTKTASATCLMVDPTDETPHRFRARYTSIGNPAGLPDGTIPVTPSSTSSDIGPLTQDTRSASSQPWARSALAPPQISERDAALVRRRAPAPSPASLCPPVEVDACHGCRIVEEPPPCVRFDAAGGMTAEAPRRCHSCARRGGLHTRPTLEDEPVSTSVGETL